MHGRTSVEGKARRVAVLGSTGSIGVQTLEVVESLNRCGGRFEIAGLAAATSWQALGKQAKGAGAGRVAIQEVGHIGKLKDFLHGSGVEVMHGDAAMVELARAADVDVVVAAVVGAAGLRPVMAAAEAGKTIALANKEALVVAGALVMALAKRHGAVILPVDSEHSAVFQSLRSGNVHEIRKITLTASGGPFRTWEGERIRKATVEEALAHPNWKMGPKITVDSATMMNKALEIIEAHWLFDLPAEKIEVVIHPQSIIHSMVEFVDGSIIAQLGTPDMRTPIQYALTHPERLEGCSSKVDWSKLKEMTFQIPDERFPALQLGYDVIRLGGTAGAVVNAANEAANENFRKGRIAFGRIVESVREVLEKHVQMNFVPEPTLEQMLAADIWARQEIG